MSCPTRTLWAFLSPSAACTSASIEEAAASVVPLRSSTTCTWMWRADRLITRRGVSALPEIFLRSRACRRSREARRASDTFCPTGLRVADTLSFVVEAILLTCLSDLAADLLALVANALALVGVWAPQAADVRRDLADLLLVDTRDRELGGRLHREGDALRRLDQHGMAVAKRELEGVALELHAVADAEDLHLGGVTLGDTGDQVGDQRARQPVQRAVVPLVVGPGHHDGTVVVARHGDRLGDRELERALGSLDRHVLAVDRHVDPGGNRNRLLSNTLHSSTPLSRYHTYARTSPPTPCRAA